MVMIDHFTLSVSDFDASKRFYTAVLAPLGYKPLMEFDEMVGFGSHKPYLWLKRSSTPTTPQHIAFHADSRALVDAFHEAALALGAKDDGGPGVRVHYHPTYYGAFVIDPLNGHPIEAVSHRPVGAVKKAQAKKAAAKKLAPKKLAPKKLAPKKLAPKKVSAKPAQKAMKGKKAMKKTSKRP